MTGSARPTTIQFGQFLGAAFLLYETQIYVIR